MKSLLKKLRGSGSGLLFQATVQIGPFHPLTGGINSTSNGSSAAGPLAQFFQSGTTNNIGTFFNAAFNMAISAGAILAVLQLARAGWLYMGAADMWGSKQKAKEIMTDAILGLLLLIGIWIILNQINPCLLNLNFLQSLQGQYAPCQSS